MGGYPPHGPGHDGLTGPGGAAIDKAAPAAAVRLEVGVNLGGGGEGRGGV